MIKNQTSFIYLCSRFFCGPLEAMSLLLIFILSKELDATPWQVAILAALRPTVSLIAFYANSFFIDRPNRLPFYLHLINFVGALPFLFFPFTENAWFHIVAYGIFIAAQRAAFPLWGQILKANVGLEPMKNLVSKGLVITNSIINFFPFFLSFWMDRDQDAWCWFFVALGLLQLMNHFTLAKLDWKSVSPLEVSSSVSLKSVFIQPWIDSYGLLMTNPRFAKYLIMFFVGGSGIIATQSVIPIFFKETLNLSYAELTLVLGICKGISFIMTSPLWARWSKRISLYQFNSYIFLLSFFFFIFLSIAMTGYHWLIFAYFIYGMMAAGTELSWNISGPVFSQDQDSIPFSRLNLALSGIRGMICPLLAQQLFLSTDAFTVFAVASILAFIGMAYAVKLNFSSLKSEESFLAGDCLQSGAK